METNNRVKISSIVESQLPLFVREEYPLVSELLTEYYRSLESKGSSYDILQNIDQYVKVNNLTNLVESTTLTSNVSFIDTTINVGDTVGFPETYGLIQIGSEIVLYKSKTSTSFNDCIRGFSGTTEYSVGNTEELSFSSSQIQEHISGVEVKNLSSLFLKEFFIKVKKQFLYGFDNRELFPGVNQNLFLKQSKDFYTSKGTDRSFEILFRVLYGKDVEVILPRNYLIEPSNAQYRVTRNFVIEALQGDPESLLNQTIFQDQYGDIPKSFGTVTDIQRQIKNEKAYYTLMLDYDFDKDVIVSGSIFGDLKIHPKTVVSDDAPSGTDYITVDSTIGFPESGELVVEGAIGDILIQYNGKTINQFLNCSGITEKIIPGKEISLNTYAYGYDSSGNQIRFRITGVISEANIPANAKYHEKGDIAKILTLGYNKNYLQDNTWIFNKTVKCEVKSFTSDTFGEESKYTIETYDDNGIFAGDSVEVFYFNSSTGLEESSVFTADIPSGSIPGKFLQISVTSEKNIIISDIYYIKRKISKFSDKFASDVLGVYRDFDSNDVYVTSSSLPSYKENTTSVNDYKINFGGTFSGEILNLGVSHGFITGDAIVYLPESETNTLGIQSGVYFVKEESNKEIRLARSRSDIKYEKFVSISTTSITNSTISLLKFSKQNNLPSEIDSQRLIKLLRSPENVGENYETTHGTTGILINGVEILNYKSDDCLNYGTIKTVDVLSPGDDYDVINPPVLDISSATSGLPNALGFCGVEGFLQRIDLIDGGFDYIDTPIIDITGGNGQGTTAEPKMISYNHFVDFNPSSTNNKINLTENKIGFSTYHRFRNGELVVYNPGNNTSIGGLTTGAKYYVNVIDGYNIKFHKTQNDSIIGINTVNLTSYGVGNHRIESTNQKKKVSSIIVTNVGSSYKSNKISIPSSGINTAFDTITAYHIPYNSGDIIYYYGGDQNISGLSTGKYILTKVENQSFKLSEIGTGSTSFDFYYKTKQYVDLKSQGSGHHIFDYEPIEIKISGKNGTEVFENNIGIAVTDANIGSNTIPIDTKISNIIPGDTFNGIRVVTVGNSVSIATTNTGIGTNIINVIAPSGVLVGDFIENNSNLIEISSISSDQIELISEISSGINTGDSIKFIGDNLIGLASTIFSSISTGDSLNFKRTIDISAKIQPVIRGKITSAFIYDGGVGYGSSEIINYNQQPDYRLKYGFGAVLTPIVSNGRIVDVIINEKGSEYNSPPDLVIRGFGVGANLTPIIQNGQIIDVKIISQGINYEQKNTIIDVITPGTGCKLRFNPQIWTINNYKRLLDTSKIVQENDSVVYTGKNKNYGLQYTHLYAPKSLRNKVFAKSIEENSKYKSDLSNDTDTEKYHSPIFGWAYDGNPIYGPYGYDSPTNKKVRQILSGYSDATDSAQNRPDKNKFRKGYFVEDYKFNGEGDLDEHNGRFCVTPEFPNGTYAYFMTLNPDDKTPKFPYIIGNSYKSKPITFNFDSTINQNNFTFDQKNILKNTNPYNTLAERSFYEFFNKTKDIEFHNLEVENTKKGILDSIQVISSGNDYKVGDSLIFDISESKGNYPSAEVEYIEGRKIVGISQSTTKISDVEFYPLSGTDNTIIGFSTIPHELENNDFISIDSLLNYDTSLNETFNVEITPSRFVLTIDVDDASATGLATYFDVSGLLKYPKIRENDILTINSEKVKVLNIDEDDSRIRVLREQNSTVSTAHSAYSVILEDPRKFYIRLQKNTENQNYTLSREIYFNPNESLGIGNYIGFGHTITFSNPGSGITSIVIPQKSIYLKNHQLNTGDKIKYNSNSGTEISVSTDGIDNFKLTNGTNLYVAKISNDLIGISTVKVGLGTTGNFVGTSQTASTLFFLDPGTETYHSFQTIFDNQSKGNVIKNSITVSTASTHLLEKEDKINLSVSSGLTTTITIKYDDYNSRLVVNPRDFSFVDVENNLITIENHNYSNGHKLIHTSSSPADGLENEKIYYAVVYDKDRIRLANSYYNSTLFDKHIVNISNSSFGTLAEVNPKINITKNQKVIIDLSDTSLSIKESGTERIPAFEFSLFTDKNFKEKYFPINTNGTQKITKFGEIGVSSSARVEFKLDDNFPNFIWYNLIPRTDISLTKQKKEYKVDKEVIDYNKLHFVNSILNGEKTIVGVSSNSFTFHNEFDSSNSFLTGNYSYYTNSESEVGRIKNVKVTYSGRGYERLPSISRVTSLTGNGAILIPNSNTIGKINSGRVIDIGYNYSIDPTIKPTIKYPTILRVEPLSTIEKIEITSPGLNYNTSPDLVTIDGFTNKIVEDLILDYDLDNTEVKIIKNTNGLYDVEPKIIAVNNSNGLKISSVEYESSTKTVKVYLNKQFSDLNDFPFSVGDEILIEGISTLESNTKGYNSKNYNYSLFPVVSVYPSLGGSGAYIEYSLEDYLDENEIPGMYDSTNSFGQIISNKFLPSFKTTLSKNSFIVGESIVNENEEKGKVLKFDTKNEFLSVETIKEFPNNSLIVGKTSKSQAFIREIFESESFYNINSSSIVVNGWNKNTGFLNDDLQRIHDNDYYQYFSYSLKSEIPIKDWNDVVNNLNHTLGFKKFSDLVLNSSAPNNLGISTSQNEGSFSALCDLNSIVDIECVQDYDLVSENNFYIDDVLTSTEINFNSLILQDYSESVGNRVLKIDDISGNFNTSITKTFVTSFNI